MDRIEKEDRTVGNPKWTYLTSYSTSSSDFVCVRACVRMRGSMGERTRKFENKRRLYYLRHVKTRGRGLLATTGGPSPTPSVFLVSAMPSTKWCRSLKSGWVGSAANFSCVMRVPLCARGCYFFDPFVPVPLILNPSTTSSTQSQPLFYDI